MLQKLKLKLVVLNVVLLIVVLIAVFVSLYFLLEYELKNQENAVLNKVASSEIVKPLEMIDIWDYFDDFEDGYYDGNNMWEWEYIDFIIENEDYFLPYSSSRLFYIKLYFDYEVISISSTIVLQKKESIIELMTKVDEIDRVTGEVDLDGEDEDIRLSFLTSESPGVRIYVFIERTPREETMGAYAFAASIALVGSVICAFIVSVFMAGKSIKPVRESIESQDKFIADASHEIRTPISVIRSNAELIMESPEQTVGENIKWLEYIHKEAVRMTKMTEDLLVLSHARTVKTEKDKEKDKALRKRINLSVLITEVYDSFRQIFAQNNINAGGAEVEEDIYISAAEHEIRQLAAIFLDNAVKYTGEGGSISVSLEKDPLKNRADIKITDTGIGMPEETLEKIFERFFRIDKARSKSTGGAGLGLSIAKTITDKYGGKITVVSEPDKGSQFCVTLPL
ncbi:MAG: HAMP domain-containing histidine kinase [Oscillospiraceae bacterium]|nr:HAMP domain-containing histidine kinase [Oscillospiraceae bacterium]